MVVGVERCQGKGPECYGLEGQNWVPTKTFKKHHKKNFL